MPDLNMADTVEDPQIVDQKIINEEYKIWKKNTPFLYDMIYARALAWPTLTAQWFPDKRELPNLDCAEHRILFGTNTSGQEPNFLHIARVEIPNVNNAGPKDFNDTSGELGGYGGARKPFTFDITQSIAHAGEVNKARYMPQNPDIIASMSPDARVLVFDRTKHPLQPKDNTPRPDVELKGHEQEGFGMSWNPHVEGRLATASQDATVRLWDLTEFTKAMQSNHTSCATWTHHTATVNDVEFHPIHQHWVGSVSDDLTLQVIDDRQAQHKTALFKKEAHQDAINCLAFHPSWNPVVATGSADKTVALWDLRALDKVLHTIDVHKDVVIKVGWHPQSAAILTSAGNDRRINVYDLSRIGDEQTDEDAEEGPPELLFIHGGFTDNVTDFSWNPTDPFVMLGAAEDNQLQIFKPAKAILTTPLLEDITLPEVQE
ncbi:WD40 repeat-like protein [Trichodelitschia bisporula]|uniref:WD40 repeat-like protein n=1 Tax=Trichodelitschia bisporula TaxID=703511 RepID=A0A6G1I4A1_9PEZI|nr:WD40 repeat-like protein [Trichodelitschia bisporula]